MNRSRNIRNARPEKLPEGYDPDRLRYAQSSTRPTFAVQIFMLAGKHYHLAHIHIPLQHGLIKTACLTCGGLTRVAKMTGKPVCYSCFRAKTKARIKARKLRSRIARYGPEANDAP